MFLCPLNPGKPQFSPGFPGGAPAVVAAAALSCCHAPTLQGGIWWHTGSPVFLAQCTLNLKAFTQPSQKQGENRHVLLLVLPNFIIVPHLPRSAQFYVHITCDNDVSHTAPSLYCTTLHYITLDYTALHQTTLHQTSIHYTTLHYTTLHYTTLEYTTFHYTRLQEADLGDIQQRVRR